MGFTKLDSGIVNSSIWSEPSFCRVLWITMLAMADESGFVSCSLPGLVRAANITNEEFDISIKTLQGPDPFSRTPDNDGRRVEKIDGGWIILNFPKYRIHSEHIKEQTRERVRRFREKNKDVTLGNVTSALPSASASASGINSLSSLASLNSLALKEDLLYIVTPKNESNAPAQADNRVLTVKEPLLDGEKKVGKDHGKEHKSAFAPPTISEVSEYCISRKNDVDPEKWMSHYQSNGWMVGRNNMKDWKAAIRTWERSEYGPRKNILTSEEMMKSLNS